MEANHKWLMFVVDGSTAMEPHWPTIFSNYIKKIVRHSCSKWRQPEAKCAKVEFGLVMYYVRSDNAEWPIQGSHWTTNEDEFLEKLSTLTFNGIDCKYNAFMTHGIAEALVMFPKPPIGNPSREYFEGERHCIVVPATQTSTKSMAVHVPKIRAGQIYGSHTQCNLADYRGVAQSYITLGVSLSVISPTLFPAWREMFQLGNNTASADIPPASTRANVYFTVLISDQYREARDALTPRETMEMESSLHQTPEPHHTPSFTNYAFFSPFFPDEETNFLNPRAVLGEPSNSQQNTKEGNIPAKAAELAMDENQSVELGKKESITVSSDSSDPSLLEDKTNGSSTSQLNTPATQISPEAATAADLQNPQACFSSSTLVLSLDPSAYDEIVADLHAHGVIDEALNLPANWISPEQDIRNAYNNINSHLHNNNGDGACASSSSRRREYSGSNGGQRAGKRQREETRQPMRSITGLGRNGPILGSQPPPSLQNQPSFVNTWEGAISTTGDQGNLILLGRAKAYRKITAPPTLTATWPQWLHISDVMAQSVLDGTSTLNDRVNDLVFKMLMPNYQLFEILSTRNLCARLNLPSQTLILTPTIQPYYFIGTLVQGEFHVRQPALKINQHEAEGAATVGDTGFGSGSR